MTLDRFMRGIVVCAGVLALWGCGNSKAEKVAAGESESNIETMSESETESASQTDIGYMYCVDGSPMEDIRRLLSEKYGITIEESSGNDGEGQAGLHDGNEVFRFFEVDGGRREIVYSGEKFGDVTIFGIYPGMHVDSAWAALTEYGFYDNPGGEIENCLLADFDSGSVSVSFWAEDDNVTLISVSPYDKTAN